MPGLSHGAKRRNHLLAATIAIAFASSMFLAPPDLAADPANTNPELREQRAYWQNTYRELLTRQAQLREIVARERELYADANRRNYRRGKKRHRHRKAMMEAQAELDEIEKRLATIEDDARRAGALPGWLYQVEIELEDAARRPAISAGPGDEGRNPLYLDDASD